MERSSNSASHGDADRDSLSEVQPQAAAGRLARAVGIPVAEESELERALTRLGNAVLRGALAGFCLRGGLNLVSDEQLPDFRS